MASPPMISIRSIRSGCLVIPELTIEPGRVAITGPNGSGKTTLLEMIAGILIPSQGNITINSHDTRETTVGWVGEFPDLNMTFTRVIDEIASPLRFSHQPCREIDASVRDLARIMGLSLLLDRPVHSLSGGEKVLTALAAALITKPEILILDETDSHLDASTIGTMDAIIRDANLPYVLFATHRPDRVASADRVIVMRRGEVLRVGTPDEVFQKSYHGSDHLSPLRSLRDPVLWRAVYATDS
ncbi:energy-coupling factor ABC transporter ATP-binding protein [uncultured Methanospirillum sp.]|uniref:energy-coupling factor ABC transporter ATP-binding protein n=1 Tax=uncultured Methanospirillum sp. TaxID=262503 RepID=UPI0029C92ECD|nr:energy-coupling factor ABC transporter ATP-binding protein [uncultured Methanospirillum sp.]